MIVHILENLSTITNADKLVVIIYLALKMQNKNIFSLFLV